MDAITVENLSKNFRIYARPADRLRELFLRRKRHQDFWALKEISFRVPRGSTFGIIGENGSGKSTLLQIIAGTLQPTGGNRRVEGRVAALLELGSGFNPEFSGVENVYLNGSILGLSNEEISARLPEIERFAEIGDFIHQPVKTYSSGMYVRLAFAVSINVDPEILLVDEALAVGDVFFQQRCMRKIRQMKEVGKTILLVSHDPAAVKNLCDRALWLEKGEIRDLGEPERVVSRYLAAMTQRRDPFAAANPSRPEPKTAAPESPLVVTTLQNLDHRWGNRKAEILGVQLLDPSGESCDSAFPGDALTLRTSIRFFEAVTQPLAGFFLRNRLGEDITGINTSIQDQPLPAAAPGQVFTLDFTMQLPLLHPGNYYFSAGISDGTHESFVVCDLVENVATLLVRKREVVYGYLRFDCTVELKYISPVSG
jgi:ABC-type polysaccharide/polyol phosphate transport system ATPase subunit